MFSENFIFIQRNWLSCNSLLLKNQNEAVLIDTGYASHADLTLQVLEKHLRGQPLTTILNTHLHSDHCGGNAKLQQHYSDVEIHIPHTQVGAVNCWDTNSLSFEMTGQTCHPFKSTGGLVPGNEILICGQPWQLISSPGHDSDSLMLFQPESRVLVSADALWESGISVVFPEFSGINHGFHEALSTLDVIERLKPSTVVPGHGSTFTDVQAALDRARKKLIQFMNQPHLHAMYSAKVLIKFKLMELGKANFSYFKTWCLNAPLLQRIHQQFFDTIPLNTWMDGIFLEFQNKKSILLENDFIINC